MLLPYHTSTHATDLRLSRGSCWGARWAALCVPGLAVRWMTAVRAAPLVPTFVDNSGPCSLESATAAASRDASTSIQAAQWRIHRRSHKTEYFLVATMLCMPG